MKCKCGKNINKHSKFEICISCRENRTCKCCNTLIGKGSNSGLCMSCAQKNKTPILRHREKEISQHEIIPIFELFNFLEGINLNYYSKWKTREFIRAYPIEYKNILYYSTSDNSKNYNLSDRINAILNDCSLLYKRNSYGHLLLKNGPVLGFIKFQNRHPDHKGQGSLQWYTEKYGIEGEEKYLARYSKIFNNLPYSKISQELFNELPKGYYTTNNHEIKLIVPTNNELKQKHIFPDYVYKNKIIEFDGDYWHRDTEILDKQKDNFYKSLGFNVLRIRESEYKLDKTKVIKKCLKFLDNQ